MSVPQEFWADHARYDLDAARAMQETGNYLYVLFCCQQAVEKALKAVIVGKTAELPPRIHNLILLAQAADMKIPDDRTAAFLRELSSYYIQSRYPEEIEAPRTRIDQTAAAEVLKTTEGVLEWLFATLQ